MKEYIAKTGGRYTYNDDLLNLQELAMSMTAIFEGCSNFIVSGCEITGGKITPGYVWINGKVRYFEGCTSPTFPYYIYEKNGYETITYAGDVNKHGRCNYLSIGADSVPQVPDEVTGLLPSFIEMTVDYSPRFIDKFIGRYAVLLDSPFARQKINKELVLAGNFTSEKDIQSKTALSVVNPDNGYELRNIVKATGDASMGVYERGILVQEIVVATDGSFTLYNQGIELARIDQNGIKTKNIRYTQLDSASMRFQGSDIYNYSSTSDDGQIHINRLGYNDGKTKFRTLHIYDGRNSAAPLFSVIGKDGRVNINALTSVSNSGYGLQLVNSTYSKNDTLLKNAFSWLDKEGVLLAQAGFTDTVSLDFSIRNSIGNLILASTGWIDLQGEVRIGSKPITEIYVSIDDHRNDLAGKVDKVPGKQLSTEDFTTAYKQKLDSILKSDLSGGGDGFVTASDVAEALNTKLTISKNLSDVPDKGAARSALELYSKTESDARFFRISNALSEATSFSASEIEGKSPEEIIKLKEQRQATIRTNIDAEKKGTGEMKLEKAQNLLDLTDKAKARQNIDVYSIAQIDGMLAGKLGSDEAYSGIPFTAELKAKLDAIKTGIFAGIDNNGVSQSQIEGYVMTSAVMRELGKYATKLLTGYSAADKVTLAENISVYSISAADAKFGTLAQGLKDLVSYLVRQGQATTAAQKTLRDNIGAAGSTDLSVYMRRDQRLSDLTMSTENDKRLACQAIGAAFAGEYQTKIVDTGWISCGGENAGTLWARQIGNVVCVQGTINTARRSSNTWGSIATIPNQISPPRFGCRQTMADFNDDHKYNRGCSFVIKAGSRTILMHERGTYNVTTELSFSYMT